MICQIATDILRNVHLLFRNNVLTVINTSLILVTIYLSYQSFKFQTRTSIRESLEQLEDIDFYHEKFSPILYKFDFRPVRGHRTTVQLKYYSYGRNPASASDNQRDLFNRTFYILNDRDYSGIPTKRLRQAIAEKLLEAEAVTDVWTDDTGIFLEYDTGNAVEVRRRTEAIFQSLSNWHSTDQESFMETFGIDSWEPLEESEQE